MGRPRTTSGTAPVGTKEHARQYYQDNVERRRELAKKYARQRTLAKHGLTEEEYEELARYGCAVCGFPHGGIAKDGTEKKLPMDHDHETGMFRGLLCTNCNTVLGLAGDDPDRLIALAMYLERSKVQKSSKCAP